MERLGTGPLDVLVCHDCPSYAGAPTWKKLNRHNAEMVADSQAQVRQAVLATSPQLVLHGHWHRRRQGDLGVSRIEGLTSNQGGVGATLLNLDTLQLVEQ